MGIWDQWLTIWNWLWFSYYGVFGLALIIVAILLRKKVIRFFLFLLGKVVPLPEVITKSSEKAKLLQPFDWVFVSMVANLYLMTRHTVFYHTYLQTWFRILYIALLAWGIVQVIRHLGNRFKGNGHLPTLNQTIQSLLYRTLSALVVVFAIMMIISELGYNMNGLLAGVGLGGLAIALAAQDMVANLFACILIVFDKPFELGDWIQTPDLEGVVEDISFRSCRIRTFDNALVSVPNSKLTNDLVINWSKMSQRRLLVYIGVTYDTSQDKLERCIQRVRKTLQANKNIVSDSIYVYFNSMNSMNMDFRVQCNVYNKGFEPFLQVREQIHYAILQIVREEGVSFASMPLFQNDWITNKM